ncbi:hypothetical protein O0L34_g6627 [Tuta absoluta]|nr:hypothetical protein O0L34_g6627 [Tuta absoluta]
MDSETVNSKRGREISSCRYCLANVGSLRNIFSVYSWKSSEEVYSKIISDTFNVAVVSMEATLDTSHEICESCVGRLRDALEFKRLVQNVEETLQRHLQMNSLGEISGAQSEREVDIEVKQEIDSLTYHGSPAFEDLPICQELDSKIVKDEPMYENVPVKEHTYYILL